MTGHPSIHPVLRLANPGHIVQGQQPRPAEGRAQGDVDGRRAAPAVAARVHGPRRLLGVGDGQPCTRQGARLLEGQDPQLLMTVETLHERRAERSEVSTAVEDQQEERVLEHGMWSVKREA